MKGFIYSLADQTDNVFYIGASTNPEIRARQHKTDSRYLDEITGMFVNYNIVDFKMEIVDEMDFKFREELIELEDYWIHQFMQWGFKLRNSTYRRHINHNKVPNDILSIFKEHSPHINPYRINETNPFTNALYSIIRNLKYENETLKLRGINGKDIRDSERK